MPTKVVDASALAAIVFNEPPGGEVEKRIEGCDLVAPSLIAYEMANVCWIKVRRDIRQRDALLAALRMPGLRIETLDVDQKAVVELALQTRLTAYDASYLWLAHDLSAELVTLDRQLAEAARRMS